MSGLEALLLGLVQGLTEFLPVSSSGHLVMMQAVLGVDDEGVAFEVAVHLATLVSVLIFYQRRVRELVMGTLRAQPDALRYAGKLVVASLPAALLVLVAGDLLEAQFEAPHVTGVCLLVTGLILWSTRATIGAAVSPAPSWTAALLIGCAQALAILPGISRSGSTVAMALALGVAPAAAAEFSFLMSVIAIAGAGAQTLPALASAAEGQGLAMALGGATALVAGVGAIWLFVRMLRSRAFYRYAYYTWAAGALFLVWLWGRC